MFQWQKFSFFDKELLTEGDSVDPMVLFKEFQPSAATAGRGQLSFGDKKGNVRVINRDFEEAHKWAAFDGAVIGMHALKRQPLLVTLGYETAGTEYKAAVKIWRLDKTDENNVPVCARQIQVFQDQKKIIPAPVSCFAVTEDLSQLAIGLGNGCVLLFDGNLLRDRTTKQIVLQPAGGPCVAGLHFREDAHSLTLFVLDTTQVISFNTRAKNIIKTVIDNEGGAELNCSVVNEDKKLVAARETAVYFYEPEEKGNCFGFDGQKKQLMWFNNYLVLVLEGGRETKRDTLTIYDLKNRFIAFNAKFESITHMVCEWGSLFVFTDGKVYQLSEKDLTSKMDLLFKKNFYGIAISLANSQACDQSFVNDIFQMYGDHLYFKGDYDGAITQYLETIAYTEPSYVIRKFLDAQRIDNLTRYLQALHEKGRANTDHTTLLLNCYTKRKDLARLTDFVKTDSGGGFDVKTAIKVCRQASYFEHALYLAQKHREHELYLKIQLEDGTDFKDALLYIASLEFEQAERFMREYGRKLLTASPDDTTTVLCALTTKWRPRPMEMRDIKVDKGDAPSTSSTSGSGSETKSALSSSVSSSSIPTASPSSSSLTPSASFSVAPGTTSPLTLTAIGGSSSSSVTLDPNAPIVKAKPEDFIHFFVGRPLHLQRFLEHVLNEPKCSTIIYNTLLELYLRQEAEEKAEGKTSGDSKDKTGASSQPRQHKIMTLLKSTRALYDVDHALVLTKMYKFEKGMLFLYGKLKLYHEILQHHMENAQHSKIIKACKRYGDQERSLWVTALSYFATKKEPCEDEIVQVLESIERHNLLPPLMVVQTLSQNATKPLSVIKDYIIRTLTNELKGIADDQGEIESYQKDTQSMREETDTLKTQATTFQGIKCHRCTNQLSLPAVHFLCMHSYHQRCVPDSDRECPKCAPEFKKVKEIKESMKASAEQHDRFFKQLDDSNDGFAQVANYFGRGLFDRNDNKANGSGGATGANDRDTPARPKD